MTIATLIICSLILIAVGIGLFLNQKTNRNTLATISNFEETTKADIEKLRTEIISKIQDLNSDTQSKVDGSKAEIQLTVKENSKFVHEELIAKAKDSDSNNHIAIESAKKAVLESLEPKLSELKSETQTLFADLKAETNQYLQKLSADINSKVDGSMQTQERQQTELINEVKGKFNKIIEEIKSPLSID